MWEGPTVLDTQPSSVKVMSYTGLTNDGQNGRTDGLLSYIGNTLQCAYCPGPLFYVTTIASRHYFSMHVGGRMSGLH